MEQRLFITEDGSHSVADPELNVTYHSRHGAVQESRHIFIEAGLKEMLKKKHEISVFELGFGTGLNALLTLIEPGNFYYEAAELFPLDTSVVSTLNYTEILKRNDLHPAFMRLHECEWNKRCAITDNFQLFKRREDVKNIILTNKFDLIYFDAFDPAAQPELWSARIFTKLFNAINSTGLLLTYCSKGVVRRAMADAGFQVEKLPGPKGKREIVRAMAP